MPAFGRPTSPTSAITLSSSRSRLDSPFSPGVDSRGARFVADLKCMLPRPPAPPRAATISSAAAARSLITSPVDSSMMSVPGGTSRVTSAPLAPWRLAGPPDPPRSARHCLRCASAASESTPGAARMITLPPAPPSPPSGPPRGTYFSRRKLRTPGPPSPAATSICTRSTNTGDGQRAEGKGGRHALMPRSSSAGPHRRRRLRHRRRSPDVPRGRT